MIKDVIVNLSVGTKDDAAAAFAVSIATSFEAYLAGVAFNYEPALPGTFSDGAAPSFIEQQQAENLNAATKAIKAFQEATRAASLAAVSHTIEASFGGAAQIFGEMARRFDLSVVGQSDPKRGAAEELLIESALFESGRPVVVVPYIQKDPLKLERVLVAWDRSRSAGRALADAMPFLKRAKSLQLVTIATRDRKAEEPAGADVITHLGRHGVKAELKPIVSQETDVTDTILSYAADASADFLVMGGYGHSRLREFVLGGVTRGMLASMTVPTLMSH